MRIFSHVLLLLCVFPGQRAAAIGKPLDDFGVKAHTQLAKLLERDLGYFPGEDALRGNIRFFQKLVVGSGDRYDDAIKIFTKADNTIAKDELKTTLENYKATTDPLGDVSTKFPLVKVANIDNVQSELD